MGLPKADRQTAEENVPRQFFYCPEGSKKIKPKDKGKDMKKSLFSLLLVLVLLLSTFGIAAAVTDGEPDGEGHPYVGLLIFDVDGSPAWRCSGTLISPTVVLTAGHCTDGATGGRIWFESDVQNIQPKTYPFAGPTTVEFSDIFTHPDFGSGSFVLHDLGLVTLSQPVVMDEYGTLPTAGQLDALKTKRGVKDVTFTSVGYGLQKSFPDATAWKESALKIRMVAYPHLLQINVPGFTGDFSMLLSNNAATGGTCFGDSGGPNFLGNSTVVAGVTSFGINSNCAGTGGVFRLDKQDLLDLINNYVASH